MPADSTTVAICAHCGQTLPVCRRCRVVLEDSNARRWQGRWVGACRRCENAERIERR